jgi:hypothetical protein
MMFFVILKSIWEIHDSLTVKHVRKNNCCEKPDQLKSGPQTFSQEHIMACHVRDKRHACTVGREERILAEAQAKL